MAKQRWTAELDNQIDELKALERACKQIEEWKDEAARLKDNLLPEMWGENEGIVLSIMHHVESGEYDKVVSEIGRIID